MQVRSFVREFPAPERPGLLLVGEPGTGKTHLAVSAMKSLLDRGHECVFWDYQNLLERIRSSYDAASGAADREVYRSALEAEVLVLDDLGAHRVTEWVEDTGHHYVSMQQSKTADCYDEPAGPGHHGFEARLYGCRRRGRVSKNAGGDDWVARAVEAV
jgi:DNA replication protein DnaC